jgi:hypothetical protein
MCQRNAYQTHKRDRGRDIKGRMTIFGRAERRDALIILWTRGAPPSRKPSIVFIYSCTSKV